jgi:hypothetical protein
MYNHFVRGNITGTEKFVVEILKGKAIRGRWKGNEKGTILNKVETMFHFKVADDCSRESKEIGCNYLCLITYLLHKLFRVNDKESRYFIKQGRAKIFKCPLTSCLN